MELTLVEVQPKIFMYIATMYILISIGFSIFKRLASDRLKRNGKFSFYKLLEAIAIGCKLPVLTSVATILITTVWGLNTHCGQGPYPCESINLLILFCSVFIYFHGLIVITFVSFKIYKYVQKRYQEHSQTLLIKRWNKRHSRYNRRANFT